MTPASPQFDKPAMDALIDRVAAEQPHFHAWPDGQSANWAVAPAVLKYLAEQLRPGMQTLETGAGQTTVAFAIAGTRHVSITPDRDQASRIRGYIRTLQVEDTVSFVHESSETALPSGEGIPDRLDLVLIDGAHRFPFPILDWYYTQHRVPVGGIMVVDDFVMPSVRILHDFLLGEDEWELVQAFQVTSFFRRLKPTPNEWDWADQKINKPHLERIAQRTGAKDLRRGLSRVFMKWRERGGS